MHNGGVLPEKADHVLNVFVTQNPNLSGQPGRSVSLSSEFIGEFIEELVGFFGKLDEEIKVFMGKTNA